MMPTRARRASIRASSPRSMASSGRERRLAADLDMDASPRAAAWTQAQHAAREGNDEAEVRGDGALARVGDAQTGLHGQDALEVVALGIGRAREERALVVEGERRGVREPRT